MSNHIDIPKELTNFFTGKSDITKIRPNVKRNVEVLNNVVYKKLLVQGDVQSGKTDNLINYINSQTETEPLFIIYLTGTKNNLLEQNSKRFYSHFAKQNEILGFEKYKTYAKEVFSDLTILNINNLLKKGITYITSELKRPDSLSDLYKIAKHINGEILIIDDEGDEASLASKTKLAIEKLVSLENCRFLSITATPFKNLYSNEDFYDSFIKLEPGEGYWGIDNFKSNYEVINSKESIEETIINPLIHWAEIITSGEMPNDSQILFNFSLYTDSHTQTKMDIIDSIKNIIPNLVNVEGMNKVALDFLINFPINNIFISNSDDTEMTKIYENKMSEGHYIVVGGGNLSRGISYNNLIIEVMINSPEVPTAGVLLQRARWLGYKKQNEFIKIYTTSDVINSFEELSELNKMTKSHILHTNYKLKFKEWAKTHKGVTI